MEGTSALALLSLIATLGYLGVFVALHLLPTGYDPVRHAVSDYAVGRHGRLFRIGLWISSAGVLALAGALIVGVGSPPLAVRDLVYLFAIPVARVGMSLFPTTLEGRRLSLSGLVHYAFAILAFTLTYLVISEITPFLRDLDPASWVSGPLRWVAWATAPELFLVVLTMIPALRRVFGLFERLFLVTTNIWFILVGLLLVAQSF